MTAPRFHPRVRVAHVYNNTDLRDRQRLIARAWRALAAGERTPRERAIISGGAAPQWRRRRRRARFARRSGQGSGRQMSEPQIDLDSFMEVVEERRFGSGDIVFSAGDA